jgi:hypothetical protein
LVLLVICRGHSHGDDAKVGIRDSARANACEGAGDDPARVGDRHGYRDGARNGLSHLTRGNLVESDWYIVLGAGENFVIVVNRELLAYSLLLRSWGVHKARALRMPYRMVRSELFGMCPRAVRDDVLLRTLQCEAFVLWARTMYQLRRL